jgi:dUTPase
MYKRTIKLKIHNLLCDFRKSQYGNWIDLHINGRHKFEGLKLPTIGAPYIIPDDKKVGLGISMTLPKWYRIEIKPRSSTFSKWGLILTNGVGEIESDYAFEIQAHFLPFKDTTIPDGERVLQMQISLRPDAPWYMKIAELFRSGFRYEEVDVLTTTRGGFGSSDNINYNTQNLLLT